MEHVQQIWSGCAEVLHGQVSDAVWNVYLSHLSPVEIAGDTLVLAAPNSIIKDRVVERYLPLLAETLAAETGEELSVNLVIDDTMRVAVVEEPVVIAPTQPPSKPARPATATQGSSVQLDPRFSFESYVEAGSNQVAKAVARNVAERPGKDYNPLYIYGVSGLGKTHLLHAIGNYVVENYPQHRVLYVTTETFLNDYVDSLRQTKTTMFKRHYRECDILLIDDVQFMESKEGLQEELFHTYNALHNAGKQIVFTSDRPPKSIEAVEERLRSRLGAGLVVQIDPPDLETRLAILRMKAENFRTHIPDEVLYFIASNVRDNVRELEGALTRVTAFASLGNEVLSVELAQRILADLLDGAQPKQVTPEQIVDLVAKDFGCTPEEIVGPKRQRNLVTARHVAMYLVRQLCDLSYPAIGKEFGGRDHTTCINACEKIKDQLPERRPLYEQVTRLEQELRRNA